jgi:serine/threonine protein kinase
MPEMLEPGEIFAGRYRVEAELGRGGLGVVYACEHIHTGQKVALKLLLADPRRGPELESVVREKFKLEQRVWSHAPSEHIVRVLDAGNLGTGDRETGEDDAGTLYMVMELLSETLQQRVERLGVLPPVEVVRVMQQIALGLDEAHACRGPDGKPTPIIHRDLTPKNIMFTGPSGGPSSAKLLDFGIAKQLVDGALVTEVLLGTRAYTAPEQIFGRAVSAQTDVFAFGLTAYFALSGREYGPPNGPAPVRPSQRLQQQGVGGHLSEAFDRWFMCCLEQDPARRFASAGEAAQELALALAGAEALVPTPASPSSRPMADPNVPAAVPFGVRDTSELDVSIGTPEAVVAVATARIAEGRGARPGVTLRLQPGVPPAVEAEPASAGEHLSRLGEPRREHLTASSALSFDTNRPAPALASPESRRFRWGAFALAAAALGGGGLYFDWQGRSADPAHTQPQVDDELRDVKPLLPPHDPPHRPQPALSAHATDGAGGTSMSAATDGAGGASTAASAGRAGAPSTAAAAGQAGGTSTPPPKAKRAAPRVSTTQGPSPAASDAVAPQIQRPPGTRLHTRPKEESMRTLPPRDVSGSPVD